jgi:hypothetical protein
MAESYTAIGSLMSTYSKIKLNIGLCIMRLNKIIMYGDGTLYQKCQRSVLRPPELSCTVYRPIVSGIQICRAGSHSVHRGLPVSRTASDLSTVSYSFIVRGGLFHLRTPPQQKRFAFETTFSILTFLSSNKFYPNPRFTPSILL